MESKKKDIRALTKDQLRDFFVKQGDKAFRGNQVYEWLWQKSAHSFEDMTNICDCHDDMRMVWIQSCLFYLQSLLVVLHGRFEIF